MCYKTGQVYLLLTGPLEGTAIRANLNEREHDRMTQSYGNATVQATRPPLPGSVVKGTRRIDRIHPIIA